MVDEKPAVELKQAERLTLGRRRARAAIGLLRQGDVDAALNALRVDDDPESLTQFVHGVRPLGVSPAELLDCLESTDHVRHDMGGSVRKLEDRVLFGLLLALGEYQLTDLPQAERDRFPVRLADWYAHDGSSAIHGASGWLLRHWGQDEVAKNVDEAPVAYSPDREWFVLKVEPHQTEAPTRNVDGDGAHEPEASSSQIQNPKSKIQNPIYITFIVFSPGKYLIGSPENEARRDGIERRHQVAITRPFALSDREITWAQFSPFDADSGRNSHRDDWEKQYGRRLLPAFSVNWFEAASYCRWLTRRVGMADSDQCYGDPAPLEKDAEATPETGRPISRSTAFACRRRPSGRWRAAGGRVRRTPSATMA
jgi:hypothetical protein